jgi:hypothetical protein
LKRTLALALAGGSLAIGVPAALATAGGGEDASGTTAPSGPAFIQDDGQAPQPRPDREDCPEKDGSGGQGESGSADQGGSASEAPSV